MMTPAEGMPIDSANRVEVFRVRGQTIVPPENWPDQFWSHVDGRRPVAEPEATQLRALFCGLDPGVSARCHEPPWGIAFYEGEKILFTVTLCFRCSNAYVYTRRGKDLRAFDVDGENAVSLKNLLRRLTNADE